MTEGQHPLDLIKKLRDRFKQEADDLGVELVAFGVGIQGETDMEIATAAIKVTPESLLDAETRKVNEDFEALMRGVELDDGTEKEPDRFTTQAEEAKKALEDWDFD